MLNFDPHRWIAENDATAADHGLAALAGLAGTPSKTTNLPETGKVVSLERVGPRSAGCGENTIFSRPAANAANLANPERVLREWHGHLSKLDALRGPECVEPGTWADLCDDAWWLYETHASVAVRQGWTPEGLWGVRIGYPLGGGLAQFIRCGRKVMFADGAAYVSKFGVTSQRTTLMGVGLPLIWDLPR